MNINNVRKHLVPIAFTFMKGFTVERNLIYVISVEKCSFLTVPSEHIIEHTVDSNQKYRM
jgi:hypothetical protein